MLMMELLMHEITCKSGKRSGEANLVDTVNCVFRNVTVATVLTSNP